MSTPMNPSEPRPQQPVGMNKGAPQGQPVPGQPVPGQPLPGQQTAVLDSGAPAHARLPKSLNDDGGSHAIPFGRLFTVELRKMLDTRAGKWLLIIMALLIIIASGAVLWSGRDGSPDYGNFVAAAGVPMGTLLPILGILTVTSEWSQRTALNTFTLEPRRARVALAKWAAGLVLGALSILFAFAIGALMTAIAQAAFGHSANWNVGWGAVGGNILAQLVALSMGIAFGLAFQNTPAAICAYLFMPVLVSIVTSFGDALQKVGEWIDVSRTTAPLYDGSMTSDGWQKFLVAHLVWLVLPMAVGFWRLHKREVKSS